MRLMTKAAYARRRGVSRQAITRFVRDWGLATHGPRRLVDADALDGLYYPRLDAGQPQLRTRDVSGGAGRCGRCDGSVRASRVSARLALQRRAVADDGGLPAGRRALRGDSLTGVTRAARDLGLGQRTVRQAIAAGELPTYVFGQHRRLKVADVRAWIERHRVR